MVLDDVYQYEYDEANDTFNKQKIDIQFVDFYSDVEEVLQVMKKDCYEEASLYFQFEDKCNLSQKKLMFILRHEFVHLKDALHRQLTQDRINNSQVLANSIGSLTKHATSYSKRFFDYMKEMTEYVNISELHAYVPTVMGEINEMPSEDIIELSKKRDRDIRMYLVLHSDRFRFYDELQTELKRSKFMMSKADKQNFAEVFIKHIYNRTDEDGNYMYGIDFRVNNRYTEKSFDMFIDTLIDNIENIFISNCIKYLRQCRGVIEQRVYQFIYLSNNPYRRRMQMLEHSVRHYMEIAHRLIE